MHLCIYIIINIINILFQIVNGNYISFIDKSYNDYLMKLHKKTIPDNSKGIIISILNARMWLLL